jgi:hypothetical protein
MKLHHCMRLSIKIDTSSMYAPTLVVLLGPAKYRCDITFLHPISLIVCSNTRWSARTRNIDLTLHFYIRIARFTGFGAPTAVVLLGPAKYRCDITFLHQKYPLKVLDLSFGVLGPAKYRSDITFLHQKYPLKVLDLSFGVLGPAKYRSDITFLHQKYPLKVLDLSFGVLEPAKYRCDITFLHQNCAFHGFRCSNCRCPTGPREISM